MLTILKDLIRLTLTRSDPFHKMILDLTGFQPTNISLYKCALTHKSITNSLLNNTNVNNERLEYLGDAVLSAVTADYLFSVYPDCKEGFLTKMRAKLVNRNNLNKVALMMGIDKIMFLQKNAIATRKHIYGNALEAFIGAVYIDKGFKKSKIFIIEKIIKLYLDLDQLECEDKDFKSRIIQWGQKNRKEISFESHERQEEEKQQPLFIATIHIMNNLAGEGCGKTKKEAQQQAARQALSNLPSCPAE